MTIFTSLYAIPNHDRIESWRGAFRYLKQAEPLFQVKAVNRINLATSSNEKPPGNIRFVCTCAMDAVGLVVGLLLAFGMVVVLGAVMGAL